MRQMDKKWEKFKDLPYITRPGFVLSEQLFPKDIYSNEQHIIIILQSIAVYYRLLLHVGIKSEEKKLF